MQLKVVDEKYGISQTTYPNGFNLFFSDFPRGRDFVRLRANVGPANEDGYVDGISELVEHIIFGPEFKAVVSRLSDANAYTRRQSTDVYGSCRRRDLRNFLEVIYKSIVNFEGGIERFDIERRRISNEVDMYRDRADEWTQDFVLIPAIFKGTPLERTELTSHRKYSMMTREQLIEYQRRWWVACNMALVLAGRFDDKERIAEMVGETFGSMPPAEFQPLDINITLETPKIVVERRRPFRRTNVGLGWRTPADSDRAVPLQLIEAYLSGTHYSRLSAEIESAGISSYDPLCQYWDFKYCAALCITLGIPEKDLEKSVGVVMKVVDGIKHGISEGDLEAAKSVVLNEIDSESESKEKTTFNVMHHHFQPSILYRPTQFEEEVERTIPQQVSDAASLYFDTERYAMAIVRPPKTRSAI